jgi:hypothetical protein
LPRTEGAGEQATENGVHVSPRIAQISSILFSR